MAPNKTKTIIVVLVCLIAGILLLELIGNLGRRGKEEVTLTVAPSTAQVTLDGQPSKLGVVRLKPGKHTLAASLDNFTPAEQQFSVAIGKPTQAAIALSPANAEGQKYLRDNPTYQLEREGVGGLEQESRAAVSATPLRNLLPELNAEIAGPYSIDYADSTSRQNGTIIIISNSSPHGRARALAWLKDRGYNPAELEIVFKDFTNPLVGVQGEPGE